MLGRASRARRPRRAWSACARVRQPSRIGVRARWTRQLSGCAARAESARRASLARCRSTLLLKLTALTELALGLALARSKRAGRTQRDLCGAGCARRTWWAVKAPGCVCGSGSSIVGASWTARDWGDRALLTVRPAWTGTSAVGAVEASSITALACWARYGIRGVSRAVVAASADLRGHA